MYAFSLNHLVVARFRLGVGVHPLAVRSPLQEYNHKCQALRALVAIEGLGEVKRFLEHHFLPLGD